MRPGGDAELDGADHGGMGRDDPQREAVRTRRPDGGTEPVATLNGTLVAVPRTIVALLENHQRPDGSVRLPEALQPYLGGRTELAPGEPVAAR